MIKIQDIAYVRFAAPDLDAMEAFGVDFGFVVTSRDEDRLHLRGSDPARVAGGIVTFEPRARTAWHAHPLGQTLIVTAGTGLVRHWGGPIQEIKPGDVVWIPPGVKHWHGATTTTGISSLTRARGPCLSSPAA